jgi:hypothetical protein
MIISADTETGHVESLLGLGGCLKIMASTILADAEKLTKYRARNEVQRWLFRRALEMLATEPVVYPDECRVEPAGCMGNTKASPQKRADLSEGG